MSNETDAPETTSDAADLQFILQETRTILLQQILASEEELLSVDELGYRNPDLTEENVRYHLREMTDRGIVTKEKLPAGERERDLPDTFFGVTTRGEELLERAGLREEVAVWREMYDRMERTEEIERIERIRSRTDAGRSSESTEVRDPQRV
jgi:repressor of nif and glnA expression